LAHGGLERYPGARRRLLEDQPQRAPLERLGDGPLLAQGLELPRARHQGSVLGVRDVGQLQEIAFHAWTPRRRSTSASRSGIAFARPRHARAFDRMEAICAPTERGPVPPELSLRAMAAMGSRAASAACTAESAISGRCRALTSARPWPSARSVATALPTAWY